MKEAGFDDPQEVAHQTTVMGRILFYKAVRPKSAFPTAA
jgi:hypothetical protein